MVLQWVCILQREQDIVIDVHGIAKGAQWVQVVLQKKQGIAWEVACGIAMGMHIAKGARYCNRHAWYCKRNEVLHGKMGVAWYLHG